MKQLTDLDIQRMADAEFTPDNTVAARRSVRAQLNLRTLIPRPAAQLTDGVRIDLHHNSEEQAWGRIVAVANSGVRNAVIITGASGILHRKFPQWMNESTLSPRILSWAPINNGSFDVRFRRMRDKNSDL